MADELKIDKSKTALVVIDLQKGIAAMNRPLFPYTAAQLIGNSAKLADTFRANNMPTFLVHVTMSDKERLKVTTDDQWTPPTNPQPDAADIVPEMGPKEGDIVIVKKQWGAFYGTELELQLRRRGIDTIVLCGIATTFGVESTARFAYEYGFQQIFAEDAMASMTLEAHTASINVFKRMGKVRSTAQITDALK